jgi:hypothetical protein
VALLQRVTLFAPTRAARKQGTAVVAEMIKHGMTAR